MRLVSWNVNGLRACMGKGFMEFFHTVNADIVALQETKLQPHQIELELDGYEQYWHSAEKKGYSGTAVFTKQKPLSVSYDLPDMENLGFPNEGRVITLEFDEFYFVNCYTPNSQRELTRLEFRMDWEDEFRKYLTELDKKKPVIMCGDLNVAHEEIDLKNPKTNHNNAGFTDAKRLCGQLPLSLSGQAGLLFMVELYGQFPRAQHRLAHRLLCCERAVQAQDRGK